ncbi:MAG: hypothetical protein K2X27_19145 [Candidatus Obscuribacterales bacterium]|nr:hypothetical protein [Candidatus Obscuribacterales bacterium]
MKTTIAKEKIRAITLGLSALILTCGIVTESQVIAEESAQLEDPISTPPAELGFPAKWCQEHRLDKLAPYKGYIAHHA